MTGRDGGARVRPDLGDSAGRRGGGVAARRGPAGDRRKMMRRSSAAKRGTPDTSAEAAPRTGRLSLVGTPIGNLGDITLRALDTIRAADVIAAEDTRRTRILLDHYGIPARPISFGRHNRRARLPYLLAELEAGRHVVLVSDAGMPGISDPGGDLVAAAAGRNVKVEVVPGPTALAAAVAVAGIPAARLAFEGFLPGRSGPRRRRLEELAADPRTLVFFEAPHRIVRSLTDMRDILGERRAALARELTKIHEEICRGTLSELLAGLEKRPPRGEFTIVCEGWTEDAGTPPTVPRERLARELAYLLESEGMSRRDAIAELSLRHRVPRRLLYRLFP